MDARSTETAKPLEPPTCEDPEWDQLLTAKPGFDLHLDGTPDAATDDLIALGQSLRSRRWFWLLMDRARQVRQRRYMKPEAAMGRRGEDLAQRYLQARGLTVIGRNFTLPDQSGEIDIIARDGEITVFVEVKSRATDHFGAPERAVGPDKRQRITRAADYYCHRAGIEWDHVRFDLVSIVFREKPKLVHIIDAFFLKRTR